MEKGQDLSGWKEQDELWNNFGGAIKKKKTWVKREDSGSQAVWDYINIHALEALDILLWAENNTLMVNYLKELLQNCEAA